MSEQWRAIPGFEGAYDVSDLGRVRSVDRVVHSDGALRGYPKFMRGRVLASILRPDGYVQVSLSGTVFLVSRLVLLAFEGPPPADRESCHRDGNRLNNKFSNLYWGTHVENCRDRIAHGTNPNGEKNGAAKLTASDVAAIRASSDPADRLAVKYKVHPHHIARIRRGERWAHV